MSKEERSDTIYEARDENIISSRDGKSIVRLGRFLKPCAKTLNLAVGIPNTPLLSEIFSHNLQQWPSKVLFNGWKNPQKRWEEWMEKLAGRYGAIWNQTGICDSILSSKYEIRCNQNLVIGLCEFWCPETNTFVFPWGEATITLEDVKILGGFPVLGEPVTCPLNEELVKIEEEMNKKRREISRNKARKTTYSGWMNHYMENESEFEHIAFLSLWLSRYVFPTLVEDTLGKHVFPIAIHLSKGMPMALAPAVLASLYQNLRFLRKQVMIGSLESISVSGPFQLVELWACERFPNLAPSSPNLLKLGEPRAARWQKRSYKIDLPLIRSTLKVVDNFQWRPYAANLENWQHTSYYKETEQVLLDYSSLDEEFQSFVHCLRASELVGMDCKEKYMPYRVAMQFGFDQDLPGEFPGSSFPCKNVAFFIPSRSFEPGVTSRYFNWWKEEKLARKDALNEIILEQENFLENQSAKNNGDDHATVATMRMKNKEKSRDVLEKSREKGHVLISTMESNISQVKTGKNEDHCHTSVASRRSTQQDPLKMSQVLNNSNGEESHASVTPESSPFKTKKLIFEDSIDDDMPWSPLNLPPSKTKKLIFEDSIDDDMPRSLLNFPPSKTKKRIPEDSSDDDNLLISECLKRRAASSANRTSPHKSYPRSTTSSAAFENSGKSKLPMTGEGKKGSSIQLVHGAVVDEVKKEAGDSSNHDTNWVTKEVKREVIYSADDPFELFEVSNKINEVGKVSFRGAVIGGGGRKNAGESRNNPIEL